MTKQYTDRFSKATEELTTKSAYICKGCNTNYTQTEARDKEYSCCSRTMTELAQEGFGP